MADGNDLRAIEPPYNLEAEAAVIAGVLFDNNHYHFIERDFRPENFYSAPHASMVEMIRRQIGAGFVADGHTMHEQFQGCEQISDAGGLGYVAQIVQRPAMGQEMRDYMRLVASHAARRAVMRAADELTSMSAKAPEFGNAETVLSDAEAILSAYVSTQAQGGQWQNARSAAEDVFDEIEAHGSPPSIKTGIGPLDGRMGGLFRGDLTILAGRPAMGKSAIAQNIAFNAARNGHVVALFSMEMDKRQLTYRAATMQLHHDSNEVIAYRDIRKNVLRRDQLESLRRAARNLPPVEYETASGLRIDNLRSRLRRLKVARGGLDLVVVDYLQIMDIARERGQNDASAIQKVTGAFKQLAMELDCVVVLLSQLSREVERRDNKRPMLSDLRDSGAIEQDADVVIFAYRDWYYEKDDMGKGDAMSAMEQEARLKELEPRLDLIVAKARMDNPGTVTCFWSAPSAYIAQTLEEARGFQ